jgi:ABC-type glycerol-3-phosphate transport system permease component
MSAEIAVDRELLAELRAHVFDRNDRLVLEQPYVPRFFLNSAFVTVCTIILVDFITVLAACAFPNCYNLPGRQRV